MSNISHMNDDEILEMIQEAFEEDGRLDMDYIDIEVVHGSVTLNGRVGSDDELKIVDEVLDQVRIDNYKNKTWVDENLGMEDADEEEDKGFKNLSFGDDDEIEEQEYSGEDSDDDENE